MEKIIFGITGLTLGGAERVLIDISNKLSSEYDVTIFTLYSKGELEKELNDSIHLVSLYDFRYDELSKLKKLIIPFKVLFGKRKIYKKFIKDKDYFAQIAFLEGPITRIFSVKDKAKKIAWIHNDISQVFGRGIKSKIKRILDRNIYEKYDTLVFVSRDNLGKFNKLYDDMDLPHETVVNNYIDSKRIIELSNTEIEEKDLFKDDEINIVQVSRLVEQKAIERLINVHSSLIKQGFKHHIYVIGDGPLKENLSKLIKAEDVSNTFTLLGPRKNPYPYIKKADYFSLFSYFEGYPMVIEEAKILRKYILVTNTAAREALANYKEYSRIVDNNEKGIEDAIKFAIKNNKTNDNQYIYDNEKIIDKVINVIETTKKKEKIHTLKKEN